MFQSRRSLFTAVGLLAVGISSATAQKMYWVDTETGLIERAALDGTQREVLVQAERELLVLERALSARLEALSAIDVVAPESARPARIALNFSNPYAFRAAGLIGQFDGFACKVLSARHVGLIGRDESEKLLHQGGRWVRRALQSPVLYRLLGVTRDDVLQRTAKGLQAEETMGEVPDDVLRGDRRAPHAPAVVTQRESGMTEAVRLQPLRYGR